MSSGSRAGKVAAQDLPGLIRATKVPDQFAEFGRNDRGPDRPALRQQDAATQHPHRRHDLRQVGSRLGDRDRLIAHDPTVPNRLLVQHVLLYVQDVRSYKFLMRPTSKQADALAACLEDHRQLYNAALEERREAWRMRRVNVSFFAQSAQLKDIRAADPEGHGRWSFSSQRQAARCLDWAFAAFFRRVRAGETPGYPRFKSRSRFRSVTWPTHGKSCKWDSVPHPTVTRLYLQGIGHVRVHQHRDVRGCIKTVTVKREASRWYVILACDEVPTQQLESTGAVVGIDMGLCHLLTTSDGTHIPNPRYLAASAARLAEAHRSLARKKRGSTRRLRAVRRVAAAYGKVRRQRADYAHKVTLQLVREYDVIAHEALRVVAMSKRPAPRQVEDGTYQPNGATAKAGLNRAIRDASWGTFLSILAYKAESAGRVVVAVNPQNTSRRCAECGHVAKENRDKEQFRCMACGHKAHADVNAAINILRAGLALQEAPVT